MFFQNIISLTFKDPIAVLTAAVTAIQPASEELAFVMNASTTQQEKLANFVLLGALEMQQTR